MARGRGARALLVDAVVDVALVAAPPRLLLHLRLHLLEQVLHDAALRGELRLLLLLLPSLPLRSSDGGCNLQPGPCTVWPGKLTTGSTTTACPWLPLMHASPKARRPIDVGTRAQAEHARCSSARTRTGDGCGAARGGAALGGACGHDRRRRACRGRARRCARMRQARGARARNLHGRRAQKRLAGVVRVDVAWMRRVRAQARPSSPPLALAARALGAARETVRRRARGASRAPLAECSSTAGGAARAPMGAPPWRRSRRRLGVAGGAARGADPAPLQAPRAPRDAPAPLEAPPGRRSDAVAPLEAPTGRTAPKRRAGSREARLLLSTSASFVLLASSSALALLSAFFCLCSRSPSASAATALATSSASSARERSRPVGRRRRRPSYAVVGCGRPSSVVFNRRSSSVVVRKPCIGRCTPSSVIGRLP